MSSGVNLHVVKVGALVRDNDRILRLGEPDIPCAEARQYFGLSSIMAMTPQNCTPLPSPPDDTGIKSGLAWQLAG